MLFSYLLIGYTIISKLWDGEYYGFGLCRHRSKNKEVPHETWAKTIRISGEIRR